VSRDLTPAIAAHRESLEIFCSFLADDDSLVLFAMNNIAAAATELGDHQKGLSLYERVLTKRTRLFADTSQLVHVAHNNLGSLYDELGNPEAAEREFRRALAIRRAVLPPQHPSLALTLNNLGSVLRKLGRLEEAEAVNREALEMWRAVLGPDHHRVGLAAYNLASVLEDTGRFEEAESLFRTTIEIDRATYGADHPEVGFDLRRLGILLRKKGDCAEAIDALTEADEIFAGQGLPLTHQRRLTTRSATSACLATAGRYPEAEALLLEDQRALAADMEGDPEAAQRLLDQLTELYRSWGRPDDTYVQPPIAAAP
jgi:tetratricopeptide (TPR) repeat protein